MWPRESDMWSRGLVLRGRKTTPDPLGQLRGLPLVDWRNDPPPLARLTSIATNGAPKSMIGAHCHWRNDLPIWRDESPFIGTMTPSFGTMTTSVGAMTPFPLSLIDREKDEWIMIGRD
jgi:hypothetical protein